MGQIPGQPIYNGKASSSSVNKTATRGQKQIDSVAAELKAQLKSEIQKELEAQQGNPMQADETELEARLIANQTKNEAKFKVIEGTLSELKAQNESVSAWMQQAGQRLDHAETHAQMLQNEVQQTRQEVGQSQTVLQNVIQTSMASVRGELAQELSNQLSIHFGEFTEKMAKKPRTD